MENKTSKTKQRLFWLDALRGISAAFVMVLHYFHTALLTMIPFFLGASIDVSDQHFLRDTLHFYQLNIPQAHFAALANYILGYYDLGKIGVVVFFMISGFVIPLSLFRAQIPVKSFLISRFFRLYPIYWFSLLLILLFLPDNAHFGMLQIAANFTMFQKFVLIKDINGVAWTLQIELLFYILCLALFIKQWLKSDKANILTLFSFLALGVLLGIGRHITGKELPVALPLGISVMFLGFIWRKFIFKESTITTRTIFALMSAVLPLIGLTCYWAYGQDAATYVTTYFIAIAMFFLMTTVIQLNSKALAFLGEISYSTYLLHPVIGLLVIPFLLRMAPSLYIHSPLMVFFPILFTICITLLISALTFQYIEKPSIRLGRKWINSLKQPKPLAALSSIHQGVLTD